MGLGTWEVNISTDKYPQKVATALGNLAEKVLGVEYEPIAYLGSQTVNGTNHAILAEQDVLTGRDTKNIVVLIFNEKAGDTEATLIGIDRVVEGGYSFGGVAIDINTDIPLDTQEVWDEAFEGFVGSDVKPFAFIGTQMVKGTDFIFAAERTSVTKNPEKNAVLVTINPLTKSVRMVDMLATKHERMLGYAFTW